MSEIEHKYIIIKLDCENSNIEVIGTFDEKRDALEYMAFEVNNNEDYNNIWYQKLFECDDIISIYKNNYILKKSLKFKYFIKKY
jgi:hypothetical protein